MNLKILIDFNTNTLDSSPKWELSGLYNINCNFYKSKKTEPYRRMADSIFKVIINLNKGLLNTKQIRKIIIDDSQINSNEYISCRERYLKPFVEGMFLANYEFNFHKNSVKHSVLKIEGQFPSSWIIPIKSVYLARNLVNQPLSHLNAIQLSEEIKKEAKSANFEVEVYTDKIIKKLKMGGILSVNKGSVSPPTFSVLKYKHPSIKKDVSPTVLVGKGVMYDTGGLSLKPTLNSMDMMKCDMAGAATVIATISALARANSNCYVIGLVPAVENRPGGEAYVPGDIIKMMNGKSVEVLNTDAEGRLILADALHFAKRFKPALVIDVATLTGSAARAVGKYGIVAMGNISNKTKQLLEETGYTTGERVAWQPFWDDYSEELKSSVADIKNVGDWDSAGHITAGKFLEYFVEYPWFHLDIAGVAFLKNDFFYNKKGGTGAGVRLLFEFLALGKKGSLQ